MIKRILIALLFLGSMNLYAQVNISGELKKWHKVTLDFKGPQASEKDEYNPFLNYRLDVTFSHKKSGKSYRVPGFFAADGNAANSSAESGNIWRVNFAPDEKGKWKYKVDFRKGEEVAVNDDLDAGESAGFMDGKKGKFNIEESDKSGKDFRARGRLNYVWGHYLQFAETGEYFLKAGADAPENLLAYEDFDGNFANDGHKDNLVKSYEPHLNDWKEGDPVWKDRKGKGLIGAVNYLASEEMNAMSFLTMNIIGDDRNVFPYLDYDDYYRMDVSRLAQWEIVFSHAQEKGLFLHFKTQEAENQKLLDDGDLGPERKLYYRELIARFAHHLALNWNMGEENGTWGPNVKGQSKEQRQAMIRYFYENDPYQHHRVIHNGQWYDDLFGERSKLTGASLQTHKPDFSRVHAMTLDLYFTSEKAGKPWAIACDEPGDHRMAVVPDKINPNHDNARQNALWGHFLAGGWGVEWYFGYKYEHSDLSLQDWRSRENMWDQSRHALQFFENYQVPFWKMRPRDELSDANNWILASPDNADDFYAVVQKQEDRQCLVNLPEGNHEYGWFNPHTGRGLNGLLHTGTVEGGEEVRFDVPDKRDWILLIGPEGKLEAMNKNIKPEEIELFSFYDFRISEKPEYAPGYMDKGNKVLAIDAAKYRDEFAAGETIFTGPSGTYDVIITTMTEVDGESTYRLIVDGKKIGEFQNPETEEDYKQVRHRWKNVQIDHGDELLVAYNSHSNGKIPEGNAYAYSRGRWRSLAFVDPGAEYQPLIDLDYIDALPERDVSYFTFDFDPELAEKVYEEKDGLLVVEAEHFAQQSYDDVRKWYVMNKEQTPDIQPDHDKNHYEGASGNAYLEILPDTRKNHSEELIQQVNFTEDPGRIAVLYYPVWINNPGRYYVWARTCPTGSEDNGLHVGIDGKWPVSGYRMQWVSHDDDWHWDSKQRTPLVHTGENYRIFLDIEEPGLHTIMFSMREDGFEMDRWLISKDKNVLEHGYKGIGPEESEFKKE